MSFSIIIPTYNASSTIERALASVTRMQDDIDIEILVVDDGSTDDTRTKVEVIGSAISCIYFHQTTSNGGPGSARNLGIELATKDWILFLDADDELDGSIYKKIQKIIKLTYS
jgi:glycosyltransferase involved in cell wall biosynthesis